MSQQKFKVPWRSPPPDFLSQVKPGRFALLVVDMQYFFAHPNHGVCAKLKREGRVEGTRYFVTELDKAIPNIAKLVRSARRASGEIIFTRMQSVTHDGRDRSYYHSYVGAHVVPGTKGAEILEAVGRSPGDIVISKVGGGSFYGTHLDYVLRNLGIEWLLLCGVTTDGCVETTAREAADRGYRVVVAEDACAAWSQQSHEAGIWSMGTRYGVRETQQIIEKLVSLSRGSRHRKRPSIAAKQIQRV